jgi:hypothetical protein
LATTKSFAGAIQEGFVNVGIGSLSVAIAALGGERYSFPAGMVYMLQRGRVALARNDHG